MRAIRCVVAAVLAAGIVSVVAAQPGGGFNFGFGGDLSLLVLNNKELQEELKVTEAQKEKFKVASEKQSEMMKEWREAFAGGKFDKEKFTEMREKGEKINAEIKKIVDETLTAEQKKRIKQITIQQMGFAVFNDPEAKVGGKGGFGFPVGEAQKAIMKEVQETLKLSDSQKSGIKGINADFTKESRAIFQDAFMGGFDQEKMAEVGKKIEKLRKEMWAKVEELLDDDQKKAWKELTGEPFDITKLIPQFPFPKQRD
ncbi:MAG: hypothetical protein RMJ56_11410 [Gemmataceae bacterium]|nr:hypothetical protein [Gemmata sp.]MDW8198198.1 hypothetical protein [Gemmataceae bacterium]